MKNKLLLIILLIISINIYYTPGASAAPAIFDIKIGELNNNWLTVNWKTSEASTAYLFFGESPDKMNFSVGHLILGQSHSADITGLKKNKEYYFKIIATDKNGIKTESFINYFNTKDLKDDRGAVFSDFKKLQTTDKSFSASFITDEDAKIEFRYGTTREKLDKSWRNNIFKTEHQLSITNLIPNTNYFFEIVARDRDNNLTTYSGDFKTTNYSINEIKINNLIPSSYGDSPLMPERALLSFNSNVLATADVIYGTSPSRLNRTEKITTIPSLNHQIFLSKLEPDTTYYYRLRLKSDIVKNNYESQIYSFKTAPLSRDYLNLYFQSGDLVKYRSTTYLIYNEAILPIYNSNKVKEIASEIKPIEERYLNQYSESSAYWGIFHDGQVVRDKNKNTIYLIDGPCKKPIANWQVFSYLNYKTKDIVVTDSWNLGNYKTGDVINHSKEIITDNSFNNILVKSPNSKTVYLIVNNKKLPFFSEEAFKKKGYSFSQVKTISESLLMSIPEGQVII